MKPVVIKVGGALLDSPQSVRTLLGHIAQLMVTRSVVLVHGGGPVVEQWLSAMGLTSEKVNGLRVTPDAHMPFVCGALAGYANTQLCAYASVMGITPVGLSLIDANMVVCEVMDEKLGAVGIAEPQDSASLRAIIDHCQLAIVSSIGADKYGQLLNVNADQAATVIAKLLDADLLLLSNVDGVKDKQGLLLAALDESAIEYLIADGTITDGMIVKTQAALDAARQLRRPVVVGHWAASLEQVLNHQSGTQILPTTHK